MKWELLWFWVEGRNINIDFTCQYVIIDIAFNWNYGLALQK